MRSPKFSTRRAARARARGDDVPSREDILRVLDRQGVPVTEDALAQALHAAPEHEQALRERLARMERDGEVIRNRRNAILITERVDLLRGRVQGHPDGFGFLIRDDGGPDVFLGPGEMRKTIHGDRVVARITGTDRRGRPEGKIVEVVEHAHQRVIGRLHREHGILFVLAEERRISHEFLVPPDAAGGAEPGQVVIAQIVAQPSKHAQPVARVVEVLGNYADPGMEIEIALNKHALPHVFSREAERLVAALPDAVTESDRARRTDLTKLPLVTIDGETAKDFDDAVYCELLPGARRGKAGGGEPAARTAKKGTAAEFRLIVAIADVSHYVKHGDALDHDARERGNSVYFPRRVIPMLPEKLSNGLCSLNPEVERLAMVCDMRIDAAGEIRSYRFYPAVFRSHARLTYTEVAAMLEDEAGEAARRRAALVPHIRDLYRLYKVLVQARAQRGAIDFETIETEMVFDAKGKIERIVPVRRNDAHRLIEECMLAANVCASSFLLKHGHPMLYRVHEGPTPEKLGALREFLKGFGLSLGGGDKPHAADYARLLEKTKLRPDALLLQTVMLRSLQQAVYSPDNAGHFGLAYESYTHFTSPIRRYPDLLVHRAIKAALGRRRYDPGNWRELGAHCSTTERVGSPGTELEFAL